MPQIPTYTASEKAAQQNYPRDVPVEDYSGLALTGQALERSGHQVGQIGEYFREAEAKVEKLRSTLDTTSLKSAYDSGLKDKMEKLKLDSNITTAAEFEAQFRDYEGRLRKEVLGASASPMTKYAIDNHIRGAFGEQIVQARHAGNQKAIDYNVGQLGFERERLMNLAAGEPDSTKAREYTDQYNKLLDEARGSGHVNEVKFQQDRITFRSGVFDKRADILLLGENGPEMFRTAVRAGQFGGMNDKGEWDGMDPAEITKKLVKATDIDQANDRKREQAHTLETKLVKADWDTRAHFGTLTDAEIQNAKDGKNPYILSHEADTYEKLKLSPPDPKTDLVVHQLAQEYHGSTSTIDRVNTYRARANALGITKYNQAYSQFMNELQGDENAARALNNQQNTQATQKVEGAIKDNLKQPTTGGIVKFADRIIKNMDAIDRAEVEKAMRGAKNSGGGAQEIEAAGMEKIAEIQKRRTKQLEQISPDVKNRKRIYE